MDPADQFKAAMTSKQSQIGPALAHIMQQCKTHGINFQFFLDLPPDPSRPGEDFGMRGVVLADSNKSGPQNPASLGFMAVHSFAGVVYRNERACLIPLPVGVSLSDLTLHTIASPVTQRPTVTMRGEQSQVLADSEAAGIETVCIQGDAVSGGKIGLGVISRAVPPVPSPVIPDTADAQYLDDLSDEELQEIRDNADAIIRERAAVRENDGRPEPDSPDPLRVAIAEGRGLLQDIADAIDAIKNPPELTPATGDDPLLVRRLRTVLPKLRYADLLTTAEQVTQEIGRRNSEIGSVTAPNPFAPAGVSEKDLESMREDADSPGDCGPNCYGKASPPQSAAILPGFVPGAEDDEPH